MVSRKLNRFSRILAVFRLGGRSAQLLAVLSFAGFLIAAAQADVGNCNIVPAIPSVSKFAKIINGGSQGDDTTIIQKALSGLKAGDTLVFSPGSYTINKHLTVSTSNVTLYGVGATIHATNPRDGALVIQGDDVAVYGFTVEQESKTRQSTPWAGGISVYFDTGKITKPVRGTIIQGNTVKNSAAVGIFLFSAQDFTVAKNTVWRSLADGIHMTAGSHDGRIVDNVVSQTGDDMIAVVSYAGNPKIHSAVARYNNWSGRLTGLDRNIYIAGNRVSDQYWGRGIAVVGGSDITIENNTISKVPTFAGIYLTRETSYMTFGNHDILVKGNVISQIQTLRPSYNPTNIDHSPSQHGAIEVGATLYQDEDSDPKFKDAFSVSDLAIVNNTIQDVRFSAIRMGVSSKNAILATSDADALADRAEGARKILVQGNNIRNAGSNKIVAADSGLDQTSLSCRDNSLDGSIWATQCDRAIPASTTSLQVIGASLVCSADGTLEKSASPRPPSGIEAR